MIQKFKKFKNQKNIVSGHINRGKRRLGGEGKFEKVGLEGGLKHRESGGFFDVQWEWVPEGGGCNWKSPVTPGAFIWYVGVFQELFFIRSEGAGGSTMFHKITEVFGGQVIEGFVGGDQYFEINSLFYWEPVQVVEDWGDVVSWTGFGEEVGGGVLDML